MPTPVSALIHAATMVTLCHILMWINIEKFRYMLGTPEINKFIKTIPQVYDIYKKILLLQKGTMVNQQETKLFENLLKFFYYIDYFFFYIMNIDQILLVLQIKVESSETVREKTFNFKNYEKFKPSHKHKIDEEFLIWFIGFVEGDGSFIVSKNKVYFDVTQKLQDIKVLYNIKTNLGFGQVLKRPEIERNVGVYYVTGKENFLRLVHIFNGNLVSQYKKNQFKQWLEVFNQQYNESIAYIDSNPRPAFNNAWLSGFIDAEGCFIARVKNCRTSKLGKTLALEFSLSQKQVEVLEYIRDLFIHKKIYIYFDSSWEGYRFCLSNDKLLMFLIRYINQYSLKTLKRIDFFQFSRIYELKRKKEHLSPSGLENISNLCKQIHNRSLDLQQNSIRKKNI